MNISGWKYQIKRGALEFCIMLMIKQQPELQKHAQSIRYLGDY